MIRWHWVSYYGGDIWWVPLGWAGRLGMAPGHSSRDEVTSLERWVHVAGASCSHIRLSTEGLTSEVTLSEGLIRLLKSSVNTLQISNQETLAIGKRFYLFLNIYLFYFWQCWVFFAVCRLSLVAESRGNPSSRAWASHCGVFSHCRAQALGAGAQLRCTGFTAAWHVGSSWVRDRTLASCIGRWTLNHWITRSQEEVLEAAALSGFLGPLQTLIPGCFTSSSSASKGYGHVNLLVGNLGILLLSSAVLQPPHLNAIPALFTFSENPVCSQAPSTVPDSWLISSTTLGKEEIGPIHSPPPLSFSISASKASSCNIVVQSPSCIWLFATPRTAANQASLSLTISQSCDQVHVHCIGDAVHPAISSSNALFSFCPLSFPASETFPVSRRFIADDQNTGVSASASVLPVNIQG